MSETPNEQSETPQGSPEISQADIDALVGGGGETSAEGSEGAEGATDSAVVSQADVDALLDGGGDEQAAGSVDVAAEPAGEDEHAPDARVDSEGRPFDEAAAATAAAVEEEKAARAAAAAQEASPDSSPAQPSGPAPETTPLELPQLAEVTDARGDPHRVSMLHDVNLRVKLELGRTRMLVEDVLALGEGSVVELDKLAGDPVDVFVNDRLIARGEVLVLNDSFCVRISDVVSEDPHRVTV